MSGAAGPDLARTGLLAPLVRFRLIAWITGTGLLILCLVGLPLKYAAGSPGVVAVVGFLHGIFFILYVLATLDLTVLRLRWPFWKVLLVAAAGTVPVMSFVAERFVTRAVLERHAPAAMA